MCFSLFCLQRSLRFPALRRSGMCFPLSAFVHCLQHGLFLSPQSGMCFPLLPQTLSAARPFSLASIRDVFPAFPANIVRSKAFFSYLNPGCVFRFSCKHRLPNFFPLSAPLANATPHLPFPVSPPSRSPAGGRPDSLVAEALLLPDGKGRAAVLRQTGTVEAVLLASSRRVGASLPLTGAPNAYFSPCSRSRAENSSTPLTSSERKYGLPPRAARTAFETRESHHLYFSAHSLPLVRHRGHRSACRLT